MIDMITPKDTNEVTMEWWLSECRLLAKKNREWAKSVFSGEVDFDEEDERLCKDAIAATIGELKPFLETLCNFWKPWYDFAALGELTLHAFRFQQMIDHWIRPALSVAPGPRMKLSMAAAAEIRESLARMKENK